MVQQQFLVKIESIKHITHDVLQIITEKPKQYDFTAGQATKVSINNNDWKDKKESFTFTSIPTNDFLEFTIKTYPLHNGVTNQFLKLKKDDELILHSVFGSISYKEEGLFIAGGAGITPFISIFRYLKSVKQIGNNKLIFANKTKSDIILEKELKSLLGDNFINILSDEDVDGYEYGQISEDFIKANINAVVINTVYICGPPPMMEAVEKQLVHLKIDERQIIKEVF